MELKGQIKLINEAETIGNNGFRKRDIVVTTEEQYPQHILVQFVQDKCDILNGYEVGQNVTLGINLRGREWVSPQGETKYFNTIQGWRISKDENTPIPLPATNDKFESQSNLTPEQEDDLPF